jgi:hypothetical protein
MTPKIKRLGGDWDMDKKAFFLPLDAAKSIPRVLTNWQKEFAKAADGKAAAAKAKAEAEAKSRAEREAQWAKERAAQQAEWERQKKKRAAETAKARANRVQVVVGRYQVGDVVVGHGPITSFGQSWTASERKVPAKYWHGSLSEDCPRCHGDGPVEVDTGLCERCHPQSVNVQTEYCYAYFV